ncbi:Calx-beta domain-containing protein [Azospirillum soli]|uniref:Calx-beta domain-containing protein n=1 Tax=Azospirillum soli TaxID=1304799 RepID=UPI001AE721B5|nr:Calx-beta domain-containing protein [Azospirillum soli]MBP2314411.1 Ca2+-binding RTX toxin-like protein [Azospirillum soli]
MAIRTLTSAPETLTGAGDTFVSTPENLVGDVIDVNGGGFTLDGMGTFDLTNVSRIGTLSLNDTAAVGRVTVTLGPNSGRSGGILRVWPPGYAASLMLDGSAALDRLALRGGRGADSLVGGQGDDSLEGGNGDDTMRGGPGNDYISCYGADVIEYAATDNGVDTVELAPGARIVVDGFSALTVLEDSGTGTGLLAGQVQVGAYDGQTGTTKLYIGTDAQAGAEIEIIINGELTPRMLKSAGGGLTISGAEISITGPDAVVNGSTAVNATGSTGLADDTITGDADLLDSASIDGGGGSDELVVTGTGTADLTGNLAGVEMIRLQGAANVTMADSSEFQWVRGSDGDDVLSFALVAELDAGDGDDTVRAVRPTWASSDAEAAVGGVFKGGAGFDTLVVATARFSGTVSGFEAIELADGGDRRVALDSAFLDGTRTLTGGDGNDTVDFRDGGSVLLAGITGVETVTGRGGTYTVAAGGINGTAATTYSISRTDYANEAVVLDGSANRGAMTVLTGQGADRLTGGSGDDVFRSGTGQDTLSGGAGNDTFYLEGGEKLVTGGAGSDTFVLDEDLDLRGYTTRITDLGNGDRFRIGNGAVRNGAGVAVEAGAVEVSTENGVTRLHIGKDSIPGADAIIEFTGTATAANFVRNGDTLEVVGLLPTFSVAMTPAQVTEGDAGSNSFTVTVTRGTDLSGTASVSYRVVGSGGKPAGSEDFIAGAPLTATLTFADGEATKTVTLTVADDARHEGNETFVVQLLSPSPGVIVVGEASATILDDDPAGTTRTLTEAPETLAGSASDTFVAAATALAGDSIDAGGGAFALQGGGIFDFSRVTNVGSISGDGAGRTVVLGAGTVPAGARLDVRDVAGPLALDGSAAAGVLSVTGGAGGDTLRGGAGNDTLDGGGGRDVYRFAASGNGIDLLSFGGDRLEVDGLTTLTLLAQTGTGGTLTRGEVQLGVSDGTRTRLFIGTDATPGADITIDLVGRFTPDMLAVEDGGLVAKGAAITVTGPDAVLSPTDRTAATGTTTAADDTITGSAPDLASASIDASDGEDRLVVTGGGTLVLGSAITGIEELELAGAATVTATAATGLKRVAGSGGADTLTVGALASLDAGAGADTIRVEGDVVTGAFEGGDGADTLVVAARVLEATATGFETIRLADGGDHALTLTAAQTAGLTALIGGDGYDALTLAGDGTFDLGHASGLERLLVNGRSVAVTLGSDTDPAADPLSVFLTGTERGSFDGSRSRQALVVEADSGALAVDGGSGNDTLHADDGDTVRGGDGDDHIHFDGGSAIVSGGAGADRFVLDRAGNLRITDFAIGDRIGISGMEYIRNGSGDPSRPGEVVVTAAGSSTTLTFGATDGGPNRTVTLDGIYDASFFSVDSSGVTMARTHSLYSVSVSPARRIEGDAANTVTVTLSRGGDLSTSGRVSYNVSGSGYFNSNGAFSGTVFFDPWQWAKAVTLTVADNTENDGSRSYRATIFEPSGGVVVGGEAIGTILDDDVPAVTRTLTVTAEQLTGSVGHTFVTTATALAGDVIDAAGGRFRLEGGGTFNFGGVTDANAIDANGERVRIVLGAATAMEQNTLDLSGIGAGVDIDGSASARALRLSGGTGEDTLRGGAGADTLSGGDGRDVYRFAASGNGIDVIDLDGGDRVEVDGLTAFTVLAQTGNGGSLGRGEVQLATPANGRTRLQIGTDGIAGADIAVDLPDGFAPARLVVRDGRLEAVGAEVTVTGPDAVVSTTASTAATGSTTGVGDTITGSAADLASASIDGGVGSDTLVVTGGGDVDLTGRVTNVETLLLADATAVTLTDRSPSMHFVGSDGADSFTVGAVLSLAAGLGNDTVRAQGAGTVTGAFDGGDGIDTLVVESDVFSGSLTGFEAIVLADGGDRMVHLPAGFDVAAAAVTGGNGADTLSLKAGTYDLSTVTGVETIAAEGGGHFRIAGGGQVASYALTDADSVVLDASASQQDISVVLGAGNDSIVGGAGNDRYELGGGADTVTGGDGNDDFIIGAGSKLLSSGAGDDRFVFSSGSGLAGHAARIKDLGNGDQLVLGAQSIASGDGRSVGYQAAEVSHSGGITTLHLGLDHTAGSDYTLVLDGTIGVENLALASGTLTVTGLVPRLSVAVDPQNRSEGTTGGATFTVTVTRGGVLTGPVTVDYAIAGSGANPATLSDFAAGTALSGTVSFADGETTKTFSITAADDSVHKGNRAFTVTLSNASAGIIDLATATASIIEDDPAPQQPGSGGGDSGGSGGGDSNGGPVIGDGGTVPLDGGGGLSATLPAGVRLDTGGSGTPQTADAAAAELGAAVSGIAADAAERDALNRSIADYAASRGAGATVTVRTVTPAISGSASMDPIVISGPADGGEGVALVIDARNLPPGTVLQLDRVGFAVVAGPVRVVGGDGSQMATGDGAGQIMVLGADDDTLHGGGGDDFVGSKTGNDVLYGDEGNDTVQGGEDNDLLFGNTGADVLLGNTGADTLYGGRDNDTLYGGRDDDALFGDDGSDVLNGDVGNDALAGGSGADRLFGNTGHDLLFGNIGGDTLHGGMGNDTLYSGRDDDRLFGDLGDDWLFGDLGNDTLTGGAGADVFVFGQRFAEGLGDGHDVITDFSAAEGDRIQLRGGLIYTLAANGAGEAVIVFSNGGDLTLVGVRKEHMQEGWFMAG